MHIRGFCHMVEDLNDMEALLMLKESGEQLNPALYEVRDTVMWNPFHFAVYHGHLDLLKYLTENVKVNIGQTAPKNIALNEGE